MKFGKIILTLATALTLSSCAVETNAANNSFKMDYGVFLSIDSNEMSKLKNYKTVVIDAQYFEAKDIERLHADGHSVYSYINAGSVENFRDYYDDYSDLFLGEYENWEEEQWVNVSDKSWQDFISVTLAGELNEKGVDGFFVDNCDVYYNFPTNEIFDGLTNIMRGLMSYDKAVLINGGDTFADAYFNKYGHIDDIFTGINQETVFSAIDFENDKLSVQATEDRKYFQNYIEKYAKQGTDIYLLEYTTNKSLNKKIKAYCQKNDFEYYISNSIELD